MKSLIRIIKLVGPWSLVFILPRFGVDPAINNVSILKIVFVMGLIVTTVITFFDKVKSIGRGILWFFLGSLLLEDKIKGLEKNVADLKNLLFNLIKKSLYARVFYFDRMQGQIFFLHSHRPEETSHVTNSTPTNGSLAYTQPPIPKDEAPIITQLQHWSMSSNISERNESNNSSDVICSCFADDTEFRNSLITENLFIIGSNKYNAFAKLIEQEARKKDWLHFYLDKKITTVADNKDTAVTICGVAGGPHAGEDFSPTPMIPEPENGAILKDYGLFTRIPNPLGPAKDDSKSYVFMIGGCRRGGQKALTVWLTKPDTLHRLCNDYEDVSLQVIVSCEFEYVRDNEDTKIIEETVKEEWVSELQTPFVETSSI